MNIRDNEALLPVLTKMYFDFYQITGRNPKVFKASREVFAKIVKELVNLERFVDDDYELPKEKAITYRSSRIVVDPNLEPNKIFVVE